MKCFQCKRKIPLVDELLCHCKGCTENFCILHRSEHFSTCSLFLMSKKVEEEKLLKEKMFKEATKPQQILKI